MKNSLLLAFLLISPGTLLAQVESMDPFVRNITDVLSQNKFQTNTTEARALSKLEDQSNSANCTVDPETEKSCQGFADSLLPNDYKETGWKTLLEVKYRATDKKSGRNSARSTYTDFDFWEYRQSGKGNSEITTEAQLDAEVQATRDFYRSEGFDIDPFNVKVQLIIDQFQKDDVFNKLPDLKAKNDFMYQRIGEYTKSMNNDEYLRFMSSMAGYVDYNTERSMWKQTEETGLGIVTPFEQVTKSKAGICGDIHTMVAKMGEQRGWEAFTVGYALKGSQHIVTAMVDPKDKNKLMLVNYGTYETQDLNNGDWIKPTPSNKMQDLGIQMRIFKNDKTGDVSGKMQQIATIPTALGSFMSDLFKRENHIAGAMPANQNFRVEKAGAEQTRHKVSLKKDGNKITDKLAGEGIVIYEGETDDAQIYGVAVSRDVYKDIYRWDDEQKKCVLKKNKYFQLGVAASLVDLKHNDTTGNFYAYISMKGGQILHVYQSERFQFKGVIGYEFNGVSASTEGTTTFDGDFKTLLGVVADYNKGPTKIHTALTMETSVGLRNQNLMTDLSTLKSNLNPVNFNAVSLDASLTHKVNDKMSFVTDNNFTLTRVGGRVFLSTGILTGKTSIMASYQSGVKPLNIGNTLQNVNLLQNYNDMDGVRLSLTQGFGNKNRSISGSVSGYAGLSTSTEKMMPMAGASLKLNLGGSKKKKK